ncbi:hypothetical protein J3B02_001463 [Coemansia erecta]|nr:hypothetical protein J3B02_001463 [Coemansia erecta]
MQIAFGTLALAAVFATSALGQQQQQQQQPGVTAMNLPNMSLANVNFHLNRLLSMFDMSHVSTETTSAPVMMADVYDPAMNKFTALSLNVAQAGNGMYYIPVCTVDSMSSLSASSLAAQKPASEICQYAIPLSQVPSNAAQAEMSIVGHAFDAIRSAASPMFQASSVSAPGMVQMQAPFQAPVGQQEQQPEQQQQQQQ